MLDGTLVIARKEIVEHLRETRSLWASLMHLLMGPVVISLVLFSMRNMPHVRMQPVILSMTSVFLLVAAFVGGMNVAMDILAGERERRSLLPLLLNPVSRASVIMGKWLAISMFAICGVLVTYAAFAIALTAAGQAAPSFPAVMLGLIPLAALAAAMQLTLSTFCRSVKEAQTYLSLLVFVPMGIGMSIVFVSSKPAPWLCLIPLAGQQALLTANMVTPSTFALILITAACTVASLRLAAVLLQRDENVYGR